MTLSSLAGTNGLTEELDAAETVLDEAMELLRELNGWTGAGLLRMRLVGDPRSGAATFRGARALARGVARGPRPRARGGPSSCRAVVARLAWLACDLAARCAERTTNAVARLERRSPERPEQGMGSDGRSLQAPAAMEDGDFEAARPRSPGARSPPQSGTDDMPIVAMAGVVAATVLDRPGDARRPRRCSAPPRALRGAEDLRQPGGQRLAGLFVIRLMSAPARSRMTTRLGFCHARRL